MGFSDSHNNIFLTGFMGAGKSSTGRLLAVKLGYRFVDLDQEIVDQEKRSINNIFESDGEEYFRDCESKIIAGISSLSSVVYATGGGVVERLENRTKMRSLGVIVFLHAEWPTLKKRLQFSSGRPLVDPENSWDVVEDRLSRRMTLYQDADLVIKTDDLTSNQVADLIAAELDYRA